MSYFNYHAKIKKLIKDNQAVCYEITKKYNNISPAMVFYFKDNPPMPVREHRFEEYFELIAKYKIPYRQ